VVIEAAMIAPPVTSPRTVRYAPKPEDGRLQGQSQEFRDAGSFRDHVARLGLQRQVALIDLLEPVDGAVDESHGLQRFGISRICVSDGLARCIGSRASPVPHCAKAARSGT